MTEDQEQQLDQIIADFLQAQEDGRSIAEADVIAAHPELAGELREFFDDLGQMNELAGPVVSPPPMLDKIRYFGDYELLEEIARGGMGIVYKARQASLNRIVAVKLILSAHLASETEIKRFQTEAESAANLQHPNIVSVHEVGRHQGQSYFSMEYIDGENLSEIVRDHPLPPQQAAGYVRDVAEAIQYAHQQGTLHRDLKPSNVLIDQNDRVQITDFGLALRVEGDSELTRTGQVLGTPSYMPPEQAQHKRGLIGPGSDIYSIGAVLYELLTGRPPFQADSAVETLRQVIETEPISPRLLNPAVPKDLETICLKCLQKEPHKRYLTALHLADDLGRFLQGEPILARPVGRVERMWRWCRRKPALAGSVASLCVSIMALMGLAIDHSYRRELEAAYGDLSQTHSDLEATNIQLEQSLGRERGLTGQLRQSLSAESLAKSELQGTLEKLSSAKDAAEILSRQRAEALVQSEDYLYMLRIVSAQQAIEATDVDRAEELLENCPPELRDWEWYYLKKFCHGELQSHNTDNGVLAAGCDSTGDTIYSADIDRLVTIWNPIDGELRKLTLQKSMTGSSPRCAVFNTLARKVAFGDADGRVIVFDLENGAEILNHDLHTGAVNSMTFSPDGQMLASVADDSGEQTVVVANFSDSSLQTFRLQTSFPNVVKFAWDGAKLAISGVRSESSRQHSTDVKPIDQTMSVIDLSSGRVDEYQIKTPIVNDLEFMRDADSLITANADGLIRGWGRKEDMRLQFTLHGHVGSVRKIRLIRGTANVADRLVSCGDDQTIRTWSIQNLAPLTVLYGHAGEINSLNVSSDGWRIVSSSTGGTLKVWDAVATSGGISAPIEKQGNYVSASFSGDDRYLALGESGGGQLRVLDADTGKQQTVFDRKKSNDVQFQAGSDLLFVSGYGSELSKYNWRSHEELYERRLQIRGTGGGFRFAVSHDSRLLAVGARGSIVIHQTEDGEETYRLTDGLEERNFIIDLAFTPDDKHIVAAVNAEAGWGGEAAGVFIWNCESQKLVTKLTEFQQAIFQIDVSRDGRLVAAGGGKGLTSGSAGSPGEIKIWDLQSGRLLHDLRGHQSVVWAVDFSPNSNRLASAGGMWNTESDVGELKLWELKYGHQILEIPANTNVITDVVFSHNGKRLAATARRKVQLWTVSPKEAQP